MDSLIFDEKKKEFTVLDGSLGKYSFYDVVSSQIVYEDAKYKDKSPMFSHKVLVSTLNLSIFIEMKKIYVAGDVPSGRVLLQDVYDLPRHDGG